MKAGIWLNIKYANIITIDDGTSNFKTIESRVDTSSPKGGSRSKTPYGPMDKMDEKKVMARKEHQVNRYLDDICHELRKASHIYIFGPSLTKLRLRDRILQDRSIKGQILAIDNADEMTINQKVAAVKAFFISNQQSL